MSKYTMEVREICSHFSGVDDRYCTNVDKNISKSWESIFTTKCKFFDEEYRKVLCSKILKHYYMREMGSETVGLFILWLNTRLEEIMPYYNKLYSSALLEFDPFKDTDYKRESTRKTIGKKEENGEIKQDTNSVTDETGESNGNKNSNNVNRNLYNATPQGGITGLETERYLTDARKITDAYEENTGLENTTHSENNGTLDSKTKTNEESNLDEDYIEKITGKQNAISYSELLEKYRRTFLNIDLLVINEFKDLFLNLW